MKTLEGKIIGITAATIALKMWNGVMGPRTSESLTGAVPQYGFKVMEKGKTKGTEVFFNAFNNIKRGDIVKVEYEEQRDESKMAYKIDVLENEEVVERYIRDY